MRAENLIASLRAVASRLRGFVSSRRLDADFRDELSAHLSMLEDENLRRCCLWFCGCRTLSVVREGCGFSANLCKALLASLLVRPADDHAN